VYMQSRSAVAVLLLPVLFLSLFLIGDKAASICGDMDAHTSHAAVLFDEGLDCAFLYLRTDTPLPEEGPWPVFESGAEARVVSWSGIHERGGRFYCFELAFDNGLEPGQVLDLFLMIGEARIASWSGRAHSVFHVGRSHYDYLLRATRIDFEDDGIRVGLYNEADRRKLPIRLESVSVNGRDATAAAIFPEDALPADRHHYEEDERFLFLPAEYVDAFPARIDIQFSVMTDDVGDEQAWDGNQGRLALLVDEGCPFPIGVAPSPVLPDSVCLHHGGLRDLPTLETLLERAGTARLSCPGRVQYAQFSSVPPHDYWVSGGQHCDFAVLPFRVDLLGRDVRLEHYIANTRRLVMDMSGGVVFSTHPRRSPAGRLDPATLDWLTLCALSAGSRGALFYLGDLHEIREPQAVIDAFTRISDDVKTLAPLIRIACPADLDIRTSAKGLDIQAFLCGPDRVLLFVVNMQTTERLPKRFHHGPFWAALHENATLHFDTLLFSERPHAFDLSTGNGLPVEVDEAGFTLKLGDIALGKVIVIEANENAAQQRTSLGRLAFLAVHEQSPGTISFADGRFIDFGLTEPGERRPLRLEISNRGETARVIRLETTGSDPASGHLSSEMELTVPAKDTVIWTGTWAAPMVYNESLTEIKVTDTSSNEVFERCYITAEIAPLFQPDVPHVDFGVALEIPFRTVALSHREDVEHAQIAALSCDDVPIAYEMNERGGSFSFRPLLEAPGKFQGQLRITVKRQESDTSHEVLLPFSGELSALWRRYPESVTVFITGESTHYTAKISRYDNTPFDIISASSDTPWVRAEWEGNAQSLHELRLTIERPSADAGEARVAVICLPEDGAETTVVIPVRALMRGVPDGANNTEVEQTGEALDTLLSRVEGIVATARAIALTPENSAWVKFHALLLYEDAPEDKMRVALALLGMGDDAYLYPDTPGFDDIATPFTLRRGKPFPRQKVHRSFLLEDHWDQYLHILSMVGISSSTRIRISGENHTVADLLALSREEASVHRELPWIISAHAHYTGFSTQWENKYGQPMNLSLLAARMLDNAPNPTCFETHHLQALARILEYADSLNSVEHAQLLAAIQEQIDDAIEAIRSTQTNKGALRPPTYDEPEGESGESTAYEVFVSGHVFEFLSRALPDDMLTQPWVLRSISLLVKLLARYPVGHGDELMREQDLWHFGCFCHAVSGLAHWRLRLLQTLDKST
jgi:hypothetical protein